MNWLRPTVLASIVTLASTWPCAADDAIDPLHPFPLMVGDAAPKIESACWMPRGRHSVIVPDRPYVVEFWATWCIPCIAGIPHLTQLQEQYGDDLTVIAPAVWTPDMAEIARFVEEQGERMRYVVAIDSIPPRTDASVDARMWAFEQGRTSRAWLVASGQTGIPVAFVVDSHGRIAWIGEPTHMDEPLARIVAGIWDSEAFAEEYRTRMLALARSKPIVARLERARAAHDAKAALAATDELIALGPSMAKWIGERFEVLLVDAGEHAAAIAYARAAIAGAARDDQQALNRIASVVLERRDRMPGDLDVALAAASRSVEVTGGKHQRTLKLLAEVHAARDDFAAAADVMRRAVAVAYPFEKPEFEAQLAGYEARRER